MFDEYLEIANGDVQIANALYRIMEDLAANGTGMIQEMAQDVVEGGSLRAAFFSGIYAEDIEGPFQNFWKAYQEMPAEERLEVQTQTREYLNTQGG
ncbi:hypothetical protein AB0G04_43630 [Actinoplanes sp. NPDC023801]|uniref:hypothetical protein n=1 Tax=Actinoplanes sp. NPDC023801 TaxID=3154595 RepID=UPI0033CE4BC9